MAEVTAFRHNALPFPIYGAPWAVVFPCLDADGDPVTAMTTPDTEVSKNGDTFADCTNEAVEIATGSGIYYILLTATEMTADIVAIQAKSATAGMKTTVLTLYPRKLVTMRSGTTAGGSSTTIILDSGASALNDYYNGMVCIATLDAVVEVRMIGDYVGSTKTATIEGPNWINAAPDTDDTFIIKMVEGSAIDDVNVSSWLGTVVTAATAGVPDTNAIRLGGTVQTGRDVGTSVLLSTGTGTGQLDFTSGVVKSNLVQTLGSAITGTASQIAAAFTKFFDKATPTGTINSLPDAVPGAAGGTFIAGTNAATTITTGLTTTFTGNVTGSVGSVTGAVGSVTGAVGSVTGNVGGNVTGTVGAAASVTGNVGGNVTGSVGSIAAGGITASSIATDAIGAAELAADAVAEIADAVWDELTSGHAVAGSTGVALTSASAPTAATVASAVWDLDATGHQTQGTFGQAIGDPAATAKSIWGIVNAIPDSGALTTLQADTDNIQTRLPTTLVGGRMDSSIGAMAADVITAAATATDFTTEVTSGLATGANVTAVAAAVWDLDATTHQTAGTFGKALGDPLARTNSLMQSVPDAVAGATNGLFIAGTNAATTITTGLTTTFTGNLSGNVTGSVGSVTGAVGSVTGAVGSVTGAVGSVTGNVGGNVVGTVGAAASVTGNVGGNVTGSVGSVASGGITAASFAADAITAAKVAADVGTEIAAAVAAPTAATVASAVWDLDATGHQTQGTFGQVLGDSTSTATSVWTAATSGASAATVAAAVWDLDATAHQTAGTFGKAIGDPLTATNSLIQRTPDAVAGATGGLFIAGTNAATTITTGLTATLTGNLTGSVGSIATAGITASSFAADAITAAAIASDADATAQLTDIQARIPAALVSGRIDASVGAVATDTLNAAALATDAVTEIVNAVWAKVGSDPTGVPATNASLGAKVDWLCAWSRNKQTVNRTTGVTNLRDDADATTIGTMTVSDDGTTFTRPKVT